MASTEWPHDPDGDEGSEGMRKYGMAILAKKVENAAFPLSIEELREEVGDHPVRINHRTVVPAREILEHVDIEEATDKVEFHRAVGRAMREGGFWEFDPAEERGAT